MRAWLQHVSIVGGSPCLPYTRIPPADSALRCCFHPPVCCGAGGGAGSGFAEAHSRMCCAVMLAPQAAILALVLVRHGCLTSPLAGAHEALKPSVKYLVRPAVLPTTKLTQDRLQAGEAAPVKA